MQVFFYKIYTNFNLKTQATINCLVVRSNLSRLQAKKAAKLQLRLLRECGKLEKRKKAKNKYQRLTQAEFQAKVAVKLVTSHGKK